MAIQNTSLKRLRSTKAAARLTASGMPAWRRKAM